MKSIYLFVLLACYNCSTAQKSVNKVEVFVPSTFYTYGEESGSMNNVVRNSETMAFRFKTYDTSKKKAMIYEVLFTNPLGYYKSVLSGSQILEVNDLYVNANLIFPAMLFYKKNMEHTIGIGFGVGSLIGRDYYDENRTNLTYNATLPELKSWKYWNTTFLLDYGFEFKIAKKIGFDLGIRYTTSLPLFEKASTFKITQGSGVTFRYGLFYQFK